MIRRLGPICFVAALAACGLESSGQSPSNDGGAIVDVYIDRGSGVTDSGAKCTCFASPPVGWAFVAYQRDGTPPCGGAFPGNPRVAVEATGAAPTCACTCAGAAGATCTVTADNVQVWTNSNCGGGSDKTIVGDQPCFDINPDYNPNGGVSAKGTATTTVSGGTCGAPSPAKNVPPADVHTGGSCALAGALGSGCSAENSCVPDPPAGLAVCIVSDTPNATCPSGYASVHAVGDSFADTRDCGACTCDPSPTCTVKGQFFNDNGTCASNKAEANAFALDGACHVVGNSGFAGHSLGTTTTVTQGCTAKGFQPAGAVTVGSPYTICCP